MPEEGGLKKTLGIIAVILTIIGSVITVYEKWGIVSSMISGFFSWVWGVLLWIWHLHIPVLWVPTAYIIYLLTNNTWITPDNETLVPSERSLREILAKNVERKIVGICVKSKHSDEILTELNKTYPYIESLDYYLTRLERVNAIEFNSNDGTWISTRRAIEIIMKYHGAF